MNGGWVIALNTVEFAHDQSNNPQPSMLLSFWSYYYLRLDWSFRYFWTKTWVHMWQPVIKCDSLWFHSAFHQSHFFLLSFVLSFFPLFFLFFVSPFVCVGGEVKFKFTLGGSRGQLSVQFVLYLGFFQILFHLSSLPSCLRPGWFLLFLFSLFLLLDFPLFNPI